MLKRERTALCGIPPKSKTYSSKFKVIIILESNAYYIFSQGTGMQYNGGFEMLNGLFRLFWPGKSGK